MQDPDDLGQGPEGPQGGDGGSPPEGSPAPAPQPEARNDRLERENAALRQELRDDRAAQLATEFNLTPAQTLELARTNRDEQRAKAEQMAGSAQPPTQPPAAPTPEQAPAPSTEPDNAGALARMEAQGEPGVDERLSLTDEMNRRIAEVPDGPAAMQTIAAIQREFRQRIAGSGG